MFQLRIIIARSPGSLKFTAENWWCSQTESLNMVICTLVWPTTKWSVDRMCDVDWIVRGPCVWMAIAKLRILPWEDGVNRVVRDERSGSRRTIKWKRARTKSRRRYLLYNSYVAFTVQIRFVLIRFDRPYYEIRKNKMAKTLKVHLFVMGGPRRK